VSVHGQTLSKFKKIKKKSRSGQKTVTGWEKIRVKLQKGRRLAGISHGKNRKSAAGYSL
jgi:hypothetical protein